MQAQIFGIGAANENPNAEVMRKMKDSFLSALVQHISEFTRDINHFVRLGRSLWPVYTSPLSPDQIERTMAAINQKRGERMQAGSDSIHSIVTFLDIRFHGQMGKISDEILGISVDSPVVLPEKFISASRSRLLAKQTGVRQPFLRDCLLLAAFICQNNRPDQDRKVFSVRGNGRREKKQRSTSNFEESTAFGSSLTDVEQLKSLRPRPFLAERVFSIFATLVKLNPDFQRGALWAKDYDMDPVSLGSPRLFSDFSRLVDMGYLHPVSYKGSIRSEQMNFNKARFWCSLAKEDAMTIARRIGVPLESYIV